jgi:hypothetical protein
MTGLIWSKVFLALIMLAVLGFSSSPVFAAGGFSGSSATGSFKLCENAASLNLASLETVLPGAFENQVTVSAVCPAGLPSNGSQIFWSDSGYSARYLAFESGFWRDAGANTR